jgi:hypothetical protein
MNIALYGVLRFHPYPNRTEHLNYGIVVFLPAGGVQVHIGASLRKVRAMYPLVEIESLRTQASEIAEIIGDANVDEALGILDALCIMPGQLKKDLGRFEYFDQDSLSRNIVLALDAQVEPALSKRKPREPRSRLFVDVRKRFSNLGILAKDQSQLPDHRVVEYYSPDPEADVKVEFALQNGLLRLAQTIDLRGDEGSVSSLHRTAAYSKAFAIDYAKKVLETSGKKSYVIVAGTGSDGAQKIMTSIQRSADEVLIWESNSDMATFFEEWSVASGKPLPAIPFAQ